MAGTKVNVKQAALSVGIFLALINGALAFIASPIFPVGNGGGMLRLVAFSFIAGAIIGAVFAWIWNLVGTKVK
ncbi:MAG TPA: hypothetical protein VJ110_00930 [Candidatus Nanoarchaeia archaeon]|nr:hypothetical protein [Candidatus Nanoarchaeia archaeon]